MSLLYRLEHRQILDHLADFLHNQVRHDAHDSDHYRVVPDPHEQFLFAEFKHPCLIGRMCISPIRWGQTQFRKSFAINMRSDTIDINQSHIEDDIWKLYRFQDIGCVHEEENHLSMIFLCTSLSQHFGKQMSLFTLAIPAQMLPIK